MSDSRNYLGNSDYLFQVYFNEYGVLGEIDKQMFDVKANDEKQTQRFHVDSTINLKEFFFDKGFTGTYAAVHGSRSHSLWITRDAAVKFFDLVHREIQGKSMSISPSDVEAYQRFRSEMDRLRAENASPRPVSASVASAPQAHSAAAANQQIRSKL